MPSDKQHEELAQLLQDVYDGGYGIATGRLPGGKERAAAKAILAAGWRKPRTVETVEKLDALPNLSVIRRGERVYQTFGNGRWFLPGIRPAYAISALRIEMGAYEVLWTPGDDE